MTNEDYQRVLDYALDLIGRRPRSISEMKGKLKRYVSGKKLDPSLITKVTAFLTEKNFLNDGDFSRWWIEQRMLLNPKGKKALIFELSAKGITRDIIDNAVRSSSIDNESEYQIARKLVSKKISLSRFSVVSAIVKIRNFLLYRGFSHEVISRVIDSIYKKE